MLLIAITRDVTADMGSCELTFLPRIRIDTNLAAEQHEAYQSTLASLGCEIIELPAEPNMPDSVFVEDTALVLDEIAVMCRPGAESRRAEVAGVRDALKNYRTVVSIQPPGTLDGGDLLCVGKVIYAGLSTRSNRSGIEQLRDIVADYGYAVEPVDTTQCLHLKSAVSQVAPDLLLINPNWISTSAFERYELIDVDESEPHAANALRVGSSVIYPTSFPRTMEKLAQRGIDLSPVDVSEIQKAEGAVTCCSLIFTS